MLLVAWALSAALLRLVLSLPPILHYSSMEAFFSFQDIPHLRCRQEFKKSLVVILLDTFQFNILPIAFLNSFFASLFTLRSLFAEVSLSVIDGTLLLLHLPIEGEEFCFLLARQMSFADNEVVQFGFELLR